MESLSQAPHSGGSHWKGLLITASILSYWIQPTSSQGTPISIVPKPPYGTVGGNVTLAIQGFSQKALSYTWYCNTTDTSDMIISYRVLTGVQTRRNIRKTVLPNGSLFISNLSLSDTGLSILEVVDSKGQIMKTEGAQLAVYAEKSTGRSNVSSLSGGTITGIVTGVLVGVALIGALIYFLLYRKTTG
ncbi:carcinoembryonic antigen-related cell adhesion molecule 4-like [Trichosurus vulpecula]|uniref:carcinoembryonic antigen-related cell adhesion molecule 4-like n=1 Tax=Trichosurus vulpecula TaxID=9337 RepID=UPI00186B4B76|nr:carcinoembryonic antigen-related cell adhesion molecule 4-like [Trichosurus vulpecula]